MKIVDYDKDTAAILVKKRQLENAGFVAEEDVYVITLEKGMLAIIKKSSFREHLKDKVRSSLGLPHLPSVELGGEELALLKKITSVKFDERIPENVLRMLSDREMEILKSLVDKGVLRVYKGGKYESKGVYSIPREAYKVVRELIEKQESAAVAGEMEESPEEVEEKKAPQQEPTKETDYAQVVDAVKALEKDGFIVIANDDLARSISQTLQEKIKKGTIMGMKGFDGKYYVMSSKKYNDTEALIKTYLSENKRATLSELSKNLKINEGLCKGVMNFLLESGDVIEKSRGKYELIS